MFVNTYLLILIIITGCSLRKGGKEQNDKKTLETTTKSKNLNKKKRTATKNNRKEIKTNTKNKQTKSKKTKKTE